MPEEWHIRRLAVIPAEAGIQFSRVGMA